jgi:hypothetical protein
LIENNTGTDIDINFSKPPYPDFFGRYEYDKDVIIGFLKKVLKAVVEQMTR